MGDQVAKVLRFAWALGVLGILLYAAYAMIAVAWKALSEVNPQFSSAVIVALGSVLVGALTVFGTKYLERQATVAKELRDRKIPVYEALLQFMFKVFAGLRSDKPVGQEEMTAFFMEFTQRLMVWGSDQVIAAWCKFQKEASGDPKRLLLAVENVIATIRTDLGHKNANLAQGDLVGLVVTDARQVLHGEQAPIVKSD